MYEMRLHQPAKHISEVLGPNTNELVCVDDVIGSGDTIVECLSEHGQPIFDWLSKNGNTIKVLAAFASLEGVNKIHNHPPFNGSVRVIADKVLSTEAGIFSPECNVFRSDDVAEKFRMDCRKLGDEIYVGFPFGWGGCAWALVTGYNVPDCSLPIIWGSSSALPWVPLFARR